MGREARRSKGRECRSCNRLFLTSADGKDFVEHVQLCARAGESGLVLPGKIIVDRPGLLIKEMGE